MARFSVIYDANVLVPAPARDLLLRVAEDGLVRAHMSTDILDEVVRAVGAQAIVTLNLEDFPRDKLSKFDLEVLHPDDFISDLVDLHPIRIARLVEAHARASKRPPKSYDQVLDALARTLPESVGRLRDS